MKQDPQPRPPGSLPCMGLLLALMALVVFAVIAANAVQPLTGLAQFDETFDQELRRPDVMTPLGENVFKAITVLGARVAMLGLAGAVLLVLLIRRWWVVALGVLFTVFTEPLLEQGLKDAFHLARPPRVQPAPARPEPQAVVLIALQMWDRIPILSVLDRIGILSHAAGRMGILSHEADLCLKKEEKKPPAPGNYGFPSGHAMGSTVGYGMLGYVLLLWPLRRRWACVALVTVLTLLVLLIGFSRLYLHAHYFSQVIGGFAAGAFWLILCITLIEVARRQGCPGRSSQ